MRWLVAFCVVIGAGGCELVFPVGDHGARDAAGAGDAAEADAGPCASVLTGICTQTPRLFPKGETCYLFCDVPMPWDDARLACEAQARRHLVTIDDAPETAFIHDRLGAIGLTDGAWIGLSQPPGSSQTFEGWSWTDGSVLAYTDWTTSTGQPNDSDGTENDEEQCAYVYDMGWGDQDCTNPHEWICQL